MSDIDIPADVMERAKALADAFWAEPYGIKDELVRVASQALLSERQRAMEELEAKLRDPNAVHANMLRGTIAKPSFEQIKHLYPAEFEAERASAMEEQREKDARIADEHAKAKWGGNPGGESSRTTVLRQTAQSIAYTIRSAS